MPRCLPAASHRHPGAKGGSGLSTPEPLRGLRHRRPTLDDRDTAAREVALLDGPQQACPTLAQPRAPPPRAASPLHPGLGPGSESPHQGGHGAHLAGPRGAPPGGEQAPCPSLDPGLTAT